MNQDLSIARDAQQRLEEENKVLKEDVESKTISMKNLAQIRTIAKKYKVQYEERSKEVEDLKQLVESQKENILTDEKCEQLRLEGQSQAEQKISQVEEAHTTQITELNEQITKAAELSENFKKEIESLKQTHTEKEDRFKTLFKNAKERIVVLQEQINDLKEENNKLKGEQGKAAGTSATKEAGNQEQIMADLEKCKKEKDEMLAEKDQEIEKFVAEIESLMQKVNQLQRQLGLQQGSKPSTSSGSSEKSTNEPPTANIKPMAGM